MRKHYLPYALALLIAIAVPSLAQEKDKDSTLERPRFSAVVFESVAPGMTAQYEEGTKKMMALLKAKGAPFTIRVRKRWNGDYTYAIPITSMATMDEYSRYWHEAIAEMNKTDWGHKRQAAVNSTRYTVWNTDTPMSYWPSKLTYDLRETSYFMVYRIRVKHANETAFHQAMMKMRKWVESLDVGRPYWVHQNILGEDGPLYVLIIPGKDPADVWNYMFKTYIESHGEEFRAMQEEVGKTAVSIIEVPGTERRDLALIPGN